MTPGNYLEVASLECRVVVDAAHCTICYEAVIRTYYQRKQARTHPLVALKAVAHKLARACYHMLCKQDPFDLNRAFG